MRNIETLTDKILQTMAESMGGDDWREFLTAEDADNLTETLTLWLEGVMAACGEDRTNEMIENPAFPRWFVKNTVGWMEI